MRNKRKGISPLVAVIMLIAFTMIVAGILAGWATRFATEQRSMLEKCVRANVVIKKAVYDDVNKNISLMLYNAGTVPLKGFQVQVTYDDNGPPMPTTWGIDSTLGANSFETFTHDLPNTSVDFVEIRSIECQGAYDLIRGYDINF
ncbi:MAG: archaellin/type IV pilin N-terminal domain-containing protein [Candidatus Aenigmatarchaeota archaeon]